MKNGRPAFCSMKRTERRPRARAAVLGHPDYHRCRRHVIDFLEHHAHQSRPSALDEVLSKTGLRSSVSGLQSPVM